MPLQIQLNYLWKVMAIRGQEESECQEVQEGPGNYRFKKVMEQIFWVLNNIFQRYQRQKDDLE